MVQTSSSALQQGLHNRQPLESYPYSSLALFMTPPLPRGVVPRVDAGGGGGGASSGEHDCVDAADFLPSPRRTFRAHVVHHLQLFPAEIVLVGLWAKKTRRTWLEFICNERC